MSAISTFRRAMRRHEKRARVMGIAQAADDIRRVRIDATCRATVAATYDDAIRFLAADRSPSGNARSPAGVFVRRRAADAVAKLRAGIAEEERTEEEGRPHVCPECYCVGAEVHAHGCREGEREAAEWDGPSDDGEGDWEEDDYT